MAIGRSQPCGHARAATLNIARPPVRSSRFRGWRDTRWRVISWPAPNASSRAPVIICIGEPGHRKEEYLYKMTRYAGDRGIALLAVDLLGSGSGAQFEKSSAARIWKPRSAISWIISQRRDDVDKSSNSDSRRQFGFVRGAEALLSIIVSRPRFVTAASGICTSESFWQSACNPRDADVFSGRTIWPSKLAP